jgi:hypothetical protein
MHEGHVNLHLTAPRAGRRRVEGDQDRLAAVGLAASTMPFDSIPSVRGLEVEDDRDVAADQRVGLVGSRIPADERALLVPTSIESFINFFEFGTRSAASTLPRAGRSS